MSQIKSINPKNIIIVGLAREGWSSYQYLQDKYKDSTFIISDDKPIDELPDYWLQEVRHKNTTYLTIDQLILKLENEFKNKQVKTQVNYLSIVITPGLPLVHPLNQAIKRLQIEPVSNTELFLNELNGQANPPLIIGITGTKGKSTTSSLIHHVLNQGNKHAYNFLAGNIGTPPLEILSDIKIKSDNFSKKGVVVLELSAHQLRMLKTSPQIAVIQDISDEHLDHFGNFESYVKGKSHITQFQKENDYVIFNHDLKKPRQLASLSPARQLSFCTHCLDQDESWSLEQSSSCVAKIQANQVVILNSISQLSKKVTDIGVARELVGQTVKGREEYEKVIQLTDLPLIGRHNWENVMPAVIIGYLLGITVNRISEALRTFKPLKHRLEKVAEIAGVLYVNDSLSTAPPATAAALASFPDKQIVLIAGGFDRGLDLIGLSRKIMISPLRGLILFPTTGQKILDNIQQLSKSDLKNTDFPIFHVNSMAEAVKRARSIAIAGDVVLLSPGAASFGLFKDYVDRGQQFVKEVTQDHSPQD